MTSSECAPKGVAIPEPLLGYNHERALSSTSVLGPVHLQLEALVEVLAPVASYLPNKAILTRNARRVPPGHFLVRRVSETQGPCSSAHQADTLGL